MLARASRAATFAESCSKFNLNLNLNFLLVINPTLTQVSWARGSGFKFRVQAKFERIIVIVLTLKAMLQ